jgi:hypothetical protein
MHHDCSSQAWSVPIWTSASIWFVHPASGQSSLERHSCGCRFHPSEGASSSGHMSGTITLASSLADLCEKAIGDVHTNLQHTDGTCSGESSFNGSANDENQQPEDAGGTLCPQAAPASADACTGSGPRTQPLTLLQQLRALQTFSACLYTQDMVSEIFVHSIIDQVRYGSSAWPAASKDAAVAGLCDMTRFCGKRLETLGTLKNAMPDLYLHLKLLAVGSSVSEETKANIADVLELRDNGWDLAKDVADEQASSTLKKNAKMREQVAAKEKQEECFNFGAMLGAAGVKVEPCESAVALGPGSAFPFLEPVESPVKMEDMLAAVRGMDM